MHDPMNVKFYMGFYVVRNEHKFWLRSSYVPNSYILFAKKENSLYVM